MFGHRGPSMPTIFEDLARYNSERYSGIVHTPEYDARMAVLQAEFYKWRDAAYGITDKENSNA